MRAVNVFPRGRFAAKTPSLAAGQVLRVLLLGGSRRSSPPTESARKAVATSLGRHSHKSSVAICWIGDERIKAGCECQEAL